MNNRRPSWVAAVKGRDPFAATAAGSRSEEHTSELQSQSNLVCRLLLEKKKKSLCRLVRNTGLPCSRSLPQSDRHPLGSSTTNEMLALPPRCVHVSPSHLT